MFVAPCKQLLNLPKIPGRHVPQVLHPVNAKANAATPSVVRFIIFLLEEFAKLAVERLFDGQLYANIPSVQIVTRKFSTFSKVFLTLTIQLGVRVSRIDSENCSIFLTIHATSSRTSRVFP